MANKKNETPGKPVVSQIPMAVSDSALVIDLPDGQKLVVGNMTHGTVIEVATWRGTGRPDSRTSRMMLGMTNAELEATITEDAKSEVVQAKSLKDGLKDPRVLAGTLIMAIVKSLKWLFDFKDQAGTKERKARPEIAKENQQYSSDVDVPKISGISKFKGVLKKRTSGRSSKRTKEVAVEQTSNSDVDKWLDEILGIGSSKKEVPDVIEGASKEVVVNEKAKPPVAKPKPVKKAAIKKTSAKKVVSKSSKSKRVR